MNIQELSKEAYRTACDHGWHEEEYSDAHYLMLVITELAEAVQADRKDRHADVERFKRWEKSPLVKERGQERAFKYYFKNCLKGSFEDELADVFIRLFDFKGKKGLFTVFNGVDKDSCTSVFGDMPFTELALYLCEMIRKIDSVPYPLQKDYEIRKIFRQIVGYCNVKGIDIEWFITQKMRYNKLRPYKHGGLKY